MVIGESRENFEIFGTDSRLNEGRQGKNVIQQQNECTLAHLELYWLLKYLLPTIYKINH